MVDWIPSLQLETWVVNVFAGSLDIFLAFALFVIFGLSGYFRMNALTMFFMLAVFLIMFNTYVTSYLLMMIGVFGGLLIGNVISKIVK